jgi:hypothetical protein
MTEVELIEKFSKVVSRGIIVHGFGLVDLFVPVKSVSNVKAWALQEMPVGLYTAVKPLNLSMKKGVKIYKVQDLAKDTSNKLYNRKEEC